MSAFFGWIANGETARGQPPHVPDGPHELILLLRAGKPHPRAEEVVESVNGNGPIPGGLGEGNPKHSSLAISTRARGERKDWLDARPDLPESRLQRYVVMGYPPHVNLDALATALSHNPHVENVERNVYFTLSVGGATAGAATSKTTALPSDPLLDPSPADPTLFQWGPHALRLPQAWELTRGREQIGVIDRGTAVDHEDLRAFHRATDDSLVFDGGSFREHLSQDLLFEDCNPDEQDPGDGVSRSTVGHGVHVAGILAGTTDNQVGIAGTCPGCSLQVMKTFDLTNNQNVQGAMNHAADALDVLAKQGSGVVSMSFGVGQAPCTQDPVDLDLFCQQMQFALDRDLFLAAASGNSRGALQFPANDPRVVAAGGAEYDAENGYAFWTGSGTFGSSFGPEQDLVAPAKDVLSTFYPGFDHNPTILCGDSFLPDSSGYGPCVGTSMAAPFVAGLGALVRSVQPLLGREQVRDVLLSTADRASSPTDTLGHGLPDARAAVERALGRVAGRTIPNRLTPLFGLYSPVDETHAFVTSPIAASALLFEAASTNFEGVGAPVSHYPEFPDAGCVVSPCDPGDVPRASLFVFTTERAPFPGSPPLVPLYRLRYDPNLPNRCVKPEPPRVPVRDYAYTTSEAGMLHFRENVVDAQGLGYVLEGIEGYLFATCSPEPECIPTGAERVLRYYHPGRDDHAIFPESELAQWQAEGYQPPGGALADVIGYAYRNVDTDGDQLIDGFEFVLGTDPAEADSDCDGVSDGAEVWTYSEQGPPSSHGPGDPLLGPCAALFADGFETGDAGRWTSVVP